MNHDRFRLIVKYGCKSSSLIGLIGCFMVLPVHSKIETFGVFGNTWSIEEKDAIDSIKNRIELMNRNGEMNQIIRDWQKKTRDRVENGPDPVAGVSRSFQNRSRLFDPTITLNDHIIDERGGIIAMAGTSVNPLKYMVLKKEYILIDGRDPLQVEWAVKKTIGNPANRVLILTGGSPTKLMRQYDKNRFYFDQAGRIVNRFGIKFVPSIIRQNGPNIEIQEYASLN